MAGTLLRTRGVRKTFDVDVAPVRALRGVDLDVDRGELVAITGPSGSGKSTLLQVVSGLERPDAGEITVDGERIDALGRDALARFRRRSVGIVFQFFNLIDSLTVHENVALPALVAGERRRTADVRARDLLDLLGLADKGGASPTVLSGGQRQRLAIARALANEPSLLLADEPTGALDSDGSREILELFRRLHRGGQTIVIVTHDAEVAAAAGRVVELRDGLVHDDPVRSRGPNGDGSVASTSPPPTTATARPTGPP